MKSLWKNSSSALVGGTLSWIFDSKWARVSTRHLLQGDFWPWRCLPPLLLHRLNATRRTRNSMLPVLIPHLPLHLHLDYPQIYGKAKAPAGANVFVVLAPRSLRSLRRKRSGGDAENRTRVQVEVVVKSTLGRMLHLIRDLRCKANENSQVSILDV